MTRDDIIRMARKAELHSAVVLEIYSGKWDALTNSEQKELLRIARFANLVAAAERDRACRIVTGLCVSDNNAEEINRAIRARGDT